MELQIESHMCFVKIQFLIDQIQKTKCQLMAKTDIFLHVRMSRSLTYSTAITLKVSTLTSSVLAAYIYMCGAVPEKERQALDFTPELFSRLDFTKLCAYIF